jgi:hypothetical protein
LTVAERLPAQLTTELRALRAELPHVSSPKLIRHARAAALHITGCRRALAEGHLVSVAAALTKSLNLGRAELETLRIPVDVLDLFPNWRAGSRHGFAPPAPHATLVAAAANLPLGPIRLALAPWAGAVPIILPLLSGLVDHLDADGSITVMVEPGKAGAKLRKAAESITRDRNRVRFETGKAATAFARDHAVAAHDARGNPLLIIPRGFRPERGKEHRPLDERAARRALGVAVKRSLLYWEGGNVLFDGHRCLVGADLIRENIGRLGITRDEVIAILESELGVRCAVLGEISRGRFNGTQDHLERSGQASYHIDLDVTPLGFVDDGKPVVMLSDPDLGLAVLPAALRHSRLSSTHGLAANVGARLQAEEYRRTAAERRPRLARYRRQLERLGYRVIGIPELRVEPVRSLAGVGNLDFGFCNVLPASHRGRPGVYYLPWGIPALDRAAAAQWRRAGVQPIPITKFSSLAHGMMALAAGLHCFVGPVPKPR